MDFPYRGYEAIAPAEIPDANLLGGLHVFLFNVLQGPPPFAPAVFSGLAAVGLASMELAR